MFLGKNVIVTKYVNEKALPVLQTAGYYPRKLETGLLFKAPLF